MKKTKHLYLYFIVLLLPLITYIVFSFSGGDTCERVSFNDYMLDNSTTFMCPITTAPDGQVIAKKGDKIESVVFEASKVLYSLHFNTAIYDFSPLTIYVVYIIKVNIYYIITYAILLLPRIVLHYLKKVGDL